MQRKKIGIWLLAGFAFGLFIIQPLGLSLYLYDETGDTGNWYVLFLETIKNTIRFGDIDQIFKNVLFGIIGSSLVFMVFLRNKIFILTKKRNDGNASIALIKNGENQFVEFKATLRWDLRQSKVNKQLEFVIAKTIAGFMNTNCGKLLIGVDDNGNILGLNQDFETLKKPDKDGFEQYLMQLIALELDTHLCTAVNVSFYRYGENDVCYIEIDPAKIPVYLSQDGRSRFYIRTGNGTRELDLPEAILHLGKEKALYN